MKPATSCTFLIPTIVAVRARSRAHNRAELATNTVVPGYDQRLRPPPSQFLERRPSWLAAAASTKMGCIPSCETLLVLLRPTLCIGSGIHKPATRCTLVVPAQHVLAWRRARRDNGKPVILLLDPESRATRPPPRITDRILTHGLCGSLRLEPPPPHPFQTVTMISTLSRTSFPRER